MKIYVLMAQRRENYEGQYGLEALACMSESDAEGNPDFLAEEKAKALTDGNLQAVEWVTLLADENAIRRVLFPSNDGIQVAVQESSKTAS